MLPLLSFRHFMSYTTHGISWSLTGILLCCMLVLPAAADPPATDSPDDGITALVEAKQQELDLLEKADTALQKTVESSLTSVAATYAEVVRIYGEARLAHSLSSGGPMSTRSSVLRLNALYLTLSTAESTLAKARGQSTLRLGRIKAIDIAPLLKSDFTPAARAVAESYLARLRALQKNLERQESKAAKLEENLLRLKADIKKTRLEREQELADSWHMFFFRNKEPLLSIELWRQPDATALWASMFTASAIREGKQLAGKTLSVSLFGCGILTLLMLCGIPLGNNATRDLPGRSAKTIRALHTTCLTASLGLTLLAVAGRFFPELVLLTSVPGMFMLGIGAIYGSTTIRRMLDPGFIKASHTPLVFLFLPASLILASEMPEKMAVPLWMLLLLGYGLTMMHYDKRRSLHGPLVGRVWFWICALLSLTAFAGYGIFSAFLFMVWFVVYVTYCTGIALTELIRLRGAARSTDSTTAVITKGMLVGFASPGVWLAACGTGVMWFNGFMGQGVIANIANFELTGKGFSLKLASLILLAALFYITRACSAIVHSALNRMSLYWPRGQRGAVLSLQTTASYILWGLYALITLHTLGVSLTSLTVIAGGLSVGLGFGMQTIFNNFISGLILLFGRSIQQGDIIQVGNLWCTVKSVTTRTTIVETFDNATIMIPNSDLVTTQVVNWTKNNATIRRDVLVGVAYGSDTRKVEKTLLALAQKHPNVLAKPEPRVVFSNFGASSLDFILRIWIDDIDNVLTTESSLRFDIDQAFKTENIEIAFPQMDLHVRTIPPAWQNLPPHPIPAQTGIQPDAASQNDEK